MKVIKVKEDKRGRLACYDEYGIKLGFVDSNLFNPSKRIPPITAAELRAIADAMDAKKCSL